MAELFGKGIGVAAGFDLGAEAPLDSRLVVETEADLEVHRNSGRAYIGMIVYVQENGRTVQLDANGEWVDFGFNEERFEENFAEAIKPLEDKIGTTGTGLTGRIETLEGLVVGGEGEGIAAILGDVEALKTAVGQAADAEHGVEGAGLIHDVDLLEVEVAKLKDKDEAIEAKQSDLEKALEALQGDGENSVAGQIDAAKEELQGVIDGVQGEVDALEEAIGAKAEGENPATGLHKEIENAAAGALEQAQGAVDAAKKELQGAIDDVDGRVVALEAATHSHDNKDVLDDIDATKVAAWDAKATVEQVEAAKKYADDAITALVDSAPDAMNTLGELAQAIKDHGDVYTAYIEEVDGKLAKKVDAVEGSRLMTEEEAVAFAAKAEKSYVDAQVQTAKDDAAAAQTAAETAQDEVDALELVVEGLAGQVGVEAAEGVEATGLFAKVAAAQAQADKGVADALAAHQLAEKGVEDAGVAQAAATKAQEEVDALELEVAALEGVVGTPATEGVEATGLFADIVALQNKDAELEQADKGLDSRIKVLEGLITGDEEVGGLEEIQGNITSLQQAVGQAPDAEGNGATGLFLEISQLKAKDGVLQQAITDEVTRATGVEKELQAAIDLINNTTIDGKVNAAKTELSGKITTVQTELQKDVADLETAVNELRGKDTTVEGDVAGLKEAVGAPAVEGGEDATGLFADIAALQAKDAELEGEIDGLSPRVEKLETDLAKEITDARAAEKANSDAISALTTNVAKKFTQIETEIKDDGILYTALVERGEGGEEVSRVGISQTEVAVMDQDDIDLVLASILPAAEPQA